MSEGTRNKFDWIAIGGLVITIIVLVVTFSRWTATLEAKVDRLEKAVDSLPKQADAAKGTTSADICRDLNKEIARAYSDGYPGSVAEPLERLLERNKCVAPLPNRN